MPAWVAIEVGTPPCGPVSAPISAPMSAPSTVPPTESQSEPGCDPPDIASMLQACNTTLHAGACVEAGPGVAAEQVAHVDVDGPTSVTLVVRGARSGSEPPTVRQLAFEPGDEARERWRTVGFTTALLVEGRFADEQRRAEQRRQEETDAPAPPSESTVAEPATEPFAALVSARLVGSSGFGVRSPKAGAHLHVAGRAWPAPLFIGVFAEYTSLAWEAKAVRGSAAWTELGLGLTAVVEVTDKWELFLHVGGLAQRLALTGRKKEEEMEASLWQPGLRGAVDWMWPIYGRWYGALGAHATWVGSPVELRVEGKPEARVPAPSGGVNIGIQYRF